MNGHMFSLLFSLFDHLIYHNTHILTIKMDEFTIASDDEIEPEVLSDREEDVERRKDVISQKFNFEDEV